MFITNQITSVDYNRHRGSDGNRFRGFLINNKQLQEFVNEYLKTVIGGDREARNKLVWNIINHIQDNEKHYKIVKAQEILYL